jgi:hypothetical protein
VEQFVAIFDAERSDQDVDGFVGEPRHCEIADDQRRLTG